MLRNFLIVLGILFLFIAFWAFSVIFAFRDTSRRALPPTERLTWIALVALFPVVGFFAYLFIRLLERFFSFEDPGGTGLRKRLTMAMRLPEVEHAPTRPMSDLFPEDNVWIGSAGSPGGPRQMPRQPLDLSGVEGPSVGMEVPLAVLPLLIGRGSQVTLSLDEDLGVSRNHAEIYDLAGILRIRDLGSTHGTYVNGERIEDRPLNPGDKIQVGGSIFLLRVRPG